MSRKGNGEGSIYYENNRSGKKRWVAAISDPDCGRVVRRFYSKDEASVWLKATLNETHAFDVCYRENMTIGEWMLLYIRTYKQSLRPSTLRLYATFMKSLLPILDLKLVDKSNQFPIQNHFNYLMSYLSPSSVHHTFSFLKSVIHKAYTLQMIPFDYSQGIIIPRKSRNLSVKVFSKEDIQAFLDYFASHKTFLHLPFLFGLYMGLRISEVLALTWDDVDFENALLTVNKTLTVDSSGAVHLVHWTKTISGMRTISIPDHLLSVLREVHATASGHVICGATKRMRSGPYISFSTFYIAFNKLRKSLGISPNLTFHCLRHTHASLLISNGVPIPLVSKRLGHATPNMTLSVYTHFVPGSDNVFKKNISMISDTFKGLDELVKPVTY